MPESPMNVVRAVLAGERRPDQLPIDDLAAACEHLNDAYRAGDPIVTDRQYDELFYGVLLERAPNHPFVNQVEPESGADLGRGRVVHAYPMLSTEKAYTGEEIERFFRRVERAAEAVAIPFEDVVFRATPKLDGIAGFDNGKTLASRGNGEVGSDLTFGIERGLVMTGGRGLGAGEIVVDQRYFEDHLESQYGLDHPRNFVAGFFAADTVKPHHEAACASGALRFVPYDTMEQAWEGSAEAFMADWKGIMDEIRSACPYLTDGIVLEVHSVESDPGVETSLWNELGSTNHHHRWQLAIKPKGESKTTTVTAVRAQTGRTGRVTPVLEIEPVRLEGASITNVTAHTASSITRLGLGPGAVVEITRAGGVIPKLIDVHQPSSEVVPITSCPSCDHELEADGEYAVCINPTCPAQAETRLIHWFRTLGTADLFGPVTAAKLVEAGHTEPLTVYALTEADFQEMGFGPGQSANLVAELARSQTEEIPDWRWLAAVGIRHLGRGDSRRLLSVYSLEEVIEGLSSEQIAAVEGFGPITSPLIAHSLVEQRDSLRALLALGFRLKSTRQAEEAAIDGVLAGKKVVFTGAMQSGSRDDMKEQARSLGAKVQSGVNGSTDILVAGERVGAKKMQAAQKHAEDGSLEILSERDWLGLIE